MPEPVPGDAVVVLTGGGPIDRAHLPELAPGTRVIAADSGVDQAHALGLTVDLVIGDLDSASPEGLARAEAAGATVERHPAAKDATDLELALRAALSSSPRRIEVLGGSGGRLDHLLANALLLAAPALAAVEVTARMGDARVTVVRRRAEITGPLGDLVSLCALHGPARGVTVSGLLFPLDGETLFPGSTRGVSNELVRERATVSLEHGVLLAIQPGQPQEEISP